MSRFLNDKSDYSAEIDFDDAVRLPGGGSTCDLYRTRWHRREVFVKRLKEEYRDKPLYLDALDKEFDIGVTLRHPSLPEYRESYRGYIIMDYIDGSTLAEMIRRRDPWLARESHVVRLFKELIEVVGYLHRHNIVHCDIKADNIMITANTGHLMLIDFDKCYTDALNDTSGDPGRYGLSAADVGSRAIDFHAIGMLAERLSDDIPDFKFPQYGRFVNACMRPDADCDELLAILDSPRHGKRRAMAIASLTLIIVAAGGYALWHAASGGTGDEPAESELQQVLTAHSDAAEAPVDEGLAASDELAAEDGIVASDIAVIVAPDEDLEADALPAANDAAGDVTIQKEAAQQPQEPSVTDAAGPVITVTDAAEPAIPVTDEQIAAARRQASPVDELIRPYFDELHAGLDSLIALKSDTTVTPRFMLASIRSLGDKEEEAYAAMAAAIKDLYPGTGSQEAWRIISQSEVYTGYKRRSEPEKREFGQEMERRCHVAGYDIRDIL